MNVNEMKKEGGERTFVCLPYSLANFFGFRRFGTTSATYRKAARHDYRRDNDASRKHQRRQDNRLWFLILSLKDDFLVFLIWRLGGCGIFWDYRFILRRNKVCGGKRKQISLIDIWERRAQLAYHMVTIMNQPGRAR